MNESRQDISCFCGGDLVKGRTVCWVCKDCGEQWWPHLWDKLQKQTGVNNKLQGEIKELKEKIEDKKNTKWEDLKEWADQSTYGDIPAKWILEKMQELERGDGK